MWYLQAERTLNEFASGRTNVQGPCTASCKLVAWKAKRMRCQAGQSTERLAHLPTKPWVHGLQDRGASCLVLCMAWCYVPLPWWVHSLQSKCTRHRPFCMAWHVTYLPCKPRTCRVEPRNTRTWKAMGALHTCSTSHEFVACRARVWDAHYFPWPGAACPWLASHEFTACRANIWGACHVTWPCSAPLWGAQ